MFGFSTLTRFTSIVWTVAVISALLFPAEVVHSDEVTPELSGVIACNTTGNDTSVTAEFPFAVSGANQNDRVFISIVNGSIRLHNGDVLRIEGVRPLHEADANIAGLFTSGSPPELQLNSSLGQDLVLRSVGPGITVDVEECNNCSFELHYRILAVGSIPNEELCGVSGGCNYSTSSGMLTFPYVPFLGSFTHCVKAGPSETVQLELRSDAVGLFSSDTLVVRAGGKTLGKHSSNQTPGRRDMLFGNKGEDLCLEYNGSDSRSFFYVLFRKVAQKTITISVRDSGEGQDIQQEYERNTLVTWLFENADNANGSLLHLVVRGASLDAIQGEFLIIGSGKVSQPLRGSPAAVLTSSVAPRTHLKFDVNGSDAYVVLFMGDRQGEKQDSAGIKSLYMEWSRTDTGQKKQSLEHQAEKSKSVWKEALLVCVDVHSTAASTWKETKAAIQETFADAANHYVQKRPNSPDQKIEPHQVLLPDMSVVQSNNSWSYRIRVLVSIVKSEEPDKVLLPNRDLKAVFRNITNNFGHVRVTSSSGNSFSLTDHCQEAGNSLGWFLFAALTLAISAALFLFIWRWGSLHYHRGTRSPPNMCGKSKADTSVATPPMPDTYHTNPVYEPSDDEGSPQFRNLQHINEESESRVVVEPQRHALNGAREAEDARHKIGGESSSSRT